MTQPATNTEPHDQTCDKKKTGGLTRALIYSPILILAGVLAAVAVNPQIAEKFTFLLGESRSTAKIKNIAVHETNIPTGMLRGDEEGAERVLVREKEESDEDSKAQPAANSAAETKPE